MVSLSRYHNYLLTINSQQILNNYSFSNIYMQIIYVPSLLYFTNETHILIHLQFIPIF